MCCTVINFKAQKANDCHWLWPQFAVGFLRRDWMAVAPSPCKQDNYGSNYDSELPVPGGPAQPQK